jgi:hypothetical protein
VLAVIITVGMAIALLLGPTWRILGGLIGIGLIILRWILIVGLIFGLMNCPLFYHHFGWTPISLIIGDHVYRSNRG